MGYRYLPTLLGAVMNKLTGTIKVVVDWPATITGWIDIEFIDSNLDIENEPIGPFEYNEGGPLNIPRILMCIHDDRVEERIQELTAEVSDLMEQKRKLQGGTDNGDGTVRGGESRIL